MSYHRHSNPPAALSITLLILGAMVAMGLYNTRFKVAEQPGLLHGYFVEERPRQQLSTIPIACPVPQPDMLLSTSPVLCLSPIFPDTVAVTDEEIVSAQTLPLSIECSIISTSETAHKQVQNQPAEHTYAPPICRVAPQPEYPAVMKATKRRGEVRVRIHIDTEGIPTAVDVISSTHIAFAQAAQLCILKRWKFIPARKNGKPVPSIANITIHFAP